MPELSMFEELSLTLSWKAGALWSCSLVIVRMRRSGIPLSCRAAALVAGGDVPVAAPGWALVTGGDGLTVLPISEVSCESAATAPG